MLWRVRATLPDRPGALALLAAECGRSEVNILGFQVFPGVDLVTDELVLDSPEGWTVDDVAALVARSGGTAVSAARCTEAALAGPADPLRPGGRVGARGAGQLPGRAGPAVRRGVRAALRTSPARTSST